jgi:hypothetical protein
MKVHELIAHLQTFDPNLDVTYACHSEQCILDKEEVDIGQACKPRPDGWVQNYRKDMPSQLYLMFPGN